MRLRIVAADGAESDLWYPGRSSAWGATHAGRYALMRPRNPWRPPSTQDLNKRRRASSWRA